MEQTPALQKAWGEYKKLSDESVKLRAKGIKLGAEGAKFQRAGWREMRKALLLWGKAIKKAHGKMEWDWVWNGKWQCYGCHLANGERFGFPPEEKSI